MDESVKDLLLKKIESLIGCLKRVEINRGSSLFELSESVDRQDIVILNLERAVQISVDMGSILLSQKKLELPDSMSDIFLTLSKHGILAESLADSLKKSVGFRNITVHEYSELDWGIVYTIAHEKVADFKSLIEVVSGLIKSG